MKPKLFGAALIWLAFLLWLWLSHPPMPPARTPQPGQYDCVRQDNVTACTRR